MDHYRPNIVEFPLLEMTFVERMAQECETAKFLVEIRPKVVGIWAELVREGRRWRGLYQGESERVKRVLAQLEGEKSMAIEWDRIGSIIDDLVKEGFEEREDLYEIILRNASCEDEGMIMMLLLLEQSGGRTSSSEKLQQLLGLESVYWHCQESVAAADAIKAKSQTIKWALVLRDLFCEPKRHFLAKQKSCSIRQEALQRSNGCFSLKTKLQNVAPTTGYNPSKTKSKKMNGTARWILPQPVAPSKRA
eukprot:CAMPEP_0172483946 /NCGR_PEP_ID=MMETSP1066-20121228/11192_1 /TAXON_ID=671091 /ORGANISM="Coscinodiscus wailesii, Strain CCMP2513" /LENGTH=248 /DNA_ID=CAMNT_0013248155 /DNA_START=484 /DNA_END=1227 /DNA_ORIENTATION=+